MKAVVIFAVAVVICWFIWFNDPTTRDNRTAAARAYQSELSRHEQQSQFDQEQYYATRAITTPINAGILIIATVAGTLILIGLGATLLLRSFRGAVTIWPNSAGQLPYWPGQLNGSQQDSALAAFHLAQLTRAQHPTPPHTFAPHLSYRNDLAGSPTALGDAESHGERSAVPTFQQLWQRGQVGNSQGILLGLDADTSTYEGIYGSWTDLYSSAILGVQGSGKTTTARFLAAQSALNGAKFVVCDPDGESNQSVAYDQTLTCALEPLQSLYVTPPAFSNEDILKSIRLARQTMYSRITGATSDDWPLIVWFDEFNTLMRDRTIAEELGPLLEEIATRGRKRNIFSALLMHQAQASRAGGSELRDVLASAYIHRVKRRIAAMVLGVPTGDLVETTAFANGEALLYRTRGTLAHIAIPWTTRADIEQVAARLRGQTITGYATLLPELSETLEGTTEVSTNDIQYWAENFVTRSDGCTVMAADLYRDYVSWCVTKSLTPLNQTAFGLGMRRAGYDKRRSSTGPIEYVNIALHVE